MKKLALEVWIGITAAGLTFLSAIGQNLFWVSLKRAVFAFVVFFSLAAVIRWGYRIFAEPADASTKTEEGHSTSSGDTTGGEPAGPAEEADDPAEAFAPLNPPRIKSNEMSVDAQDVLHAIRRFTDE